MAVGVRGGSQYVTICTARVNGLGTVNGPGYIKPGWMGLGRWMGQDMYSQGEWAWDGERARICTARVNGLGTVNGPGYVQPGWMGLGRWKGQDMYSQGEWAWDGERARICTARANGLGTLRQLPPSSENYFIPVNSPLYPRTTFFQLMFRCGIRWQTKLVRLVMQKSVLCQCGPISVAALLCSTHPPSLPPTAEWYREVLMILACCLTSFLPSGYIFGKACKGAKG